MPRFFTLCRVLAIVVGFLLLAVGVMLLVMPPPQPETDLSVAQAAYLVLGIGSFLLVPHRWVLCSRLGPYWVGLAILLPAGAAFGLAANVWSMLKQQSVNLYVLFACVLWLLLCVNAEHARRMFRS